MPKWVLFCFLLSTTYGCAPSRNGTTEESNGTSAESNESNRTPLALEAEENQLLGQAERNLKTAGKTCRDLEPAPQRPNIPFLRPYTNNPDLFRDIDPNLAPVIGADLGVVNELCSWVLFYESNYLNWGSLNNVQKISEREGRLRAYANIMTLGKIVEHVSAAPDLFRGVRTSSTGQLLVAQTIAVNTNKKYSSNSLFYTDFSVNPTMLPELQGACADDEPIPTQRERRNASVAAVAMVIDEAQTGRYDYVYLFALVTSVSFLQRLGFEDFPDPGPGLSYVSKVLWMHSASYSTFLEKYLKSK